MADSDEEDYVALGTPFEQLEEDAPRKKPVPIHEQIVTDDRGRRRFHGAFTGGFSAGYFNTVDTMEGWTPKTFVSSRSQKATERTTQRPEDFMDEEDLSEFGIAPKRIVTTQKFLPSDNSAGKSQGTSSGGSGYTLLGEKLLQDLIVPVKMSVGVKLLNQMGWKEGQGVGPRVRRTAKKTYGCAGPADTVRQEDEEDIFAVGLFFAPKDVESFEFTSKDDYHGIGYSGIDPKTALLSQRNWLGIDQHTSSIGIKGQGFGVGALEEEDEDIYGQDNLSNYDIVLSTSKSQKTSYLHGWSGPQQSSGTGGLLSIFCKASMSPPARKHYPPPVVPRDFKPVHKTEETKKEKEPSPSQTEKQLQHVEKEIHCGKQLTAKERGEALGETPLPTPKKSIFDYIADEDKARLKESKEKAKTSKECSKELEQYGISRTFTPRGPLSSSGFKPFINNPEKQARYEEYLSGKNDTFVALQSNSKMTEWERECELEEFARAAALYRPLNQTMAARFTSAKESDEKPSVEDTDHGRNERYSAVKLKMFGALTRERFEWHPNKILCKRFNIPDPYPSSSVDGVTKNKRGNVKKEEPVRQEVKAIDYKRQSGTDNQSVSSVQQDEVEINKPSALVAGFQSIVSQRKERSNQDAESFLGGPLNEEKKTEKQNVESDENVIKRAPMDLFNEIFAESSSSESDSENEEDGKVEQQNNVESDVKDNVEGNELEKQGQSTCSANDLHIPVAEKNIPVEGVGREPSPEAFGPALPTSFSGNPFNTIGFHSQACKDLSGKEEKQKRKKNKKWKNKESESDGTTSSVGLSKRRKDKKNKRSEKKEKNTTNRDYLEHKSKDRKKRSELSNSKEEKYYRQKKRKKKSRINDSESDFTGSESEDFSRQKKKKTSKYNDSGVVKSKHKKNRKEDDGSDDSSDAKYTRHKKNKRKEKEKTDKKRIVYTDKLPKTKQLDKQEYNKYHSGEYVERVTHDVTSGSCSRTLNSIEGSTSSESNKQNDNLEDYISEKDARNVKSESKDSKELEIKVPDNKDIINKLENIQKLKERKRMRAVDFM